MSESNNTANINITKIMYPLKNGACTDELSIANRHNVICWTYMIKIYLIYLFTHFYTSITPTHMTCMPFHKLQNFLYTAKTF